MRRSVLFAVVGAVVVLEVVAALYIYNAVVAARDDLRGVRVGAVADFPPSETPYAFYAPDFFVVNLSGELVAFVPYETNDHNGADCPLRWLSDRATFRDGCLGAAYTLDGVWCSGPAPRNMDRYQVTIVDKAVWVNVEAVIPGAPTAIVLTPGGAFAPGCPPVAQ